MPNADEIEQQQRLLLTHRQTLAILLGQLARQTQSYVPPAVLHNIADARAEIARLKVVLQAAGVAVDDLLGDTETPEERAVQAENNPTSGAQIAQAEIAAIVDARGANFTSAQGVHITGVQVGNAARKPKAGEQEKGST